MKVGSLNNNSCIAGDDWCIVISGLKTKKHMQLKPSECVTSFWVKRSVGQQYLVCFFSMYMDLCVVEIFAICALVRTIILLLLSRMPGEGSRVGRLRKRVFVSKEVTPGWAQMVFWGLCNNNNLFITSV